MGPIGSLNGSLMTNSSNDEISIISLNKAMTFSSRPRCLCSMCGSRRSKAAKVTSDRPPDEF